MLKSLSIVFFILFSNVFFGQLAGKIMDEVTKKPIPFATIFLSDLGTGTVSDNEGKFEFKFIVSSMTVHEFATFF